MPQVCDGTPADRAATLTAAQTSYDLPETPADDVEVVLEAVEPTAESTGLVIVASKARHTTTKPKT